MQMLHCIHSGMFYFKNKIKRYIQKEGEGKKNTQENDNKMEMASIKYANERTSDKAFRPTSSDFML